MKIKFRIRPPRALAGPPARPGRVRRQRPARLHLVALLASGRSKTLASVVLPISVVTIPEVVQDCEDRLKALDQPPTEPDLTRLLANITRRLCARVPLDDAAERFAKEIRDQLSPRR